MDLRPPLCHGVMQRERSPWWGADLVPHVSHGGCLPTSASAGHEQLVPSFNFDCNERGLGLGSLPPSQKH